MSPTVVFLAFTATWCPPCQAMHRDFAGHPLVTFVDVDQQPEMARIYGIASVPTVVAVVDGKEVGRKVGYGGKQEMERWMSKAAGELPDSKIPWWDNEYEGTYSEDPENGFPYDVGVKIQE